MHRNLRLLRLALLALSLILALVFIACTPSDAPEPEGEPTIASPGAPATAEPTGSQQAIPISEFVQQHAEISSEWDQFHGDFDQWSAGLSACHPDAMRGALNDFAVSFNSVTEQARNLTRGKTSGELADFLIVAAAEEETAFRQLRDRWQPSNIALFENVEQHRAKASQAQKNAQDHVIELRYGFQDTADPEAIEAFLEVFEPIRDDWKQLHEDYEALSGDVDNLGAKSVREGIEQHVADLGIIIDALEELPELEGAEETIEDLLTAAKAELEAFEAATTDSPSAGTASQSADSTGGAATESAGSAETETTDSADSATTATTDATEKSDATESASNGTGNAGGGALPDLEPLDTITEANATVLKQASRTIEDLADPDAERGLVELQVFDTEQARLLRTWDAFHDRYNEWRKNDGGCDRAQVVQDLEQHSILIAQLARDVRTLPSTGHLLPIYSLLTDAAARDEDAIRTLRFTWQPFALDAFKAAHQERINTESLRRQAEIAVQELVNRS